MKTVTRYDISARPLGFGGRAVKEAVNGELVKYQDWITLATEFDALQESYNQLNLERDAMERGNRALVEHTKDLQSSLDKVVIVPGPSAGFIELEVEAIRATLYSVWKDAPELLALIDKLYESARKS